jgi:hypothetical protein
MRTKAIRSRGDHRSISGGRSRDRFAPLRNKTLDWDSSRAAAMGLTAPVGRSRQLLQRPWWCRPTLPIQSSCLGPPLTAVGWQLLIAGAAAILALHARA